MAPITDPWPLDCMMNAVGQSTSLSIRPQTDHSNLSAIACFGATMKGLHKPLCLFEPL